jgi:hypothetical protein
MPSRSQTPDARIEPMSRNGRDSETALVYLVWGPLGTERVRAFAEAYRQHAPGREHRLVLLLNNVTQGSVRDACETTAEDLGAEMLETSEPRLDLAAYLEAGHRIEVEHLCFLNSYSKPLAADWLKTLSRPLQQEGVGLVGASGSYESFATNAPVIARPYRMRQFPRFPNPHVRTNAFILSRELMLALRWGPIRNKLDTWKLESGWQSMTRQIWSRGLSTLVVGRDGRAYGPEELYESRTFRRGRQPNRLIDDNRTREFEEAPPGRRQRLFELAWGKRAVDSD